ncbi:MAG: DUF1573 domain-containing protein [Muribaculaceae bacterium]|nr:DUF1573 domain-containing protein [Muribaculaceae bacterium]
MKAGCWVCVLMVVAGLLIPSASYSAGESRAVVMESADSVERLPLMLFDSEAFDFGVIVGDTVCSHSFVMTNAGTAPLVITGVYSDCGCTTAEYPHAPVMPGDTSRIVVSFNPSGRRAGSFTKLVRIRSNASPRPHRLYIKGRVRR